MEPKFVLVKLNGSSIAKLETILLLWELQVFEEKAYLVGVSQKGDKEDAFGIEESLKELAQLADTAGLMVVDSTYQKSVLLPSQIKTSSWHLQDVQDRMLLCTYMDSESKGFLLLPPSPF